VVVAFSSFFSQANNGGSWQFLFNCPEYSYALLQAGAAIDSINQVLTAYRRGFEQFIDMIDAGELEKIRVICDNDSLDEQERWRAFKSGAEHVPACDEIDILFNRKDVRRALFQDIVKYLDRNLQYLGKLEVVKKTAPTASGKQSSSTKTGRDRVSPKPASKKDAVPHFAAYLTEQYKQPPCEVSVYYTARVNIDGQATQLFLMKFKLPKGFESIGITGHLTDHLPDVDIDEINRMHKKHHKQKLVNLFYGKHLIGQLLKKKPDANRKQPAVWKALLAKLQAPTQSQIPVQVELVDQLQVGKKVHFLYEADLLYNRDPKNLPKNINKIEIGGLAPKEGEFPGEQHLLMNSSTHAAGFGRMSRSEPVVAKYRLCHIVGSDKKLLKDNPWGF
jgi:hypothetical protein